MTTQKTTLRHFELLNQLLEQADLAIPAGYIVARNGISGPDFTSERIRRLKRDKFKLVGWHHHSNKKTIVIQIVQIAPENQTVCLFLSTKDESWESEQLKVPTSRGKTVEFEFDISDATNPQVFVYLMVDNAVSQINGEIDVTKRRKHQTNVDIQMHIKAWDALDQMIVTLDELESMGVTFQHVPRSTPDYSENPRGFLLAVLGKSSVHSEREENPHPEYTRQYSLSTVELVDWYINVDDVSKNQENPVAKVTLQIRPILDFEDEWYLGVSNTSFQFCDWVYEKSLILPTNQVTEVSFEIPIRKFGDALTIRIMKGGSQGLVTDISLPEIFAEAQVNEKFLDMKLTRLLSGTKEYKLRVSDSQGDTTLELNQPVKCSQLTLESRKFGLSDEIARKNVLRLQYRGEGFMWIDICRIEK